MWMGLVGADRERDGSAGRQTGRRSRTHARLTRSMPKRTDLQSILILGSGPIVIG
jgi:hypothetical protein